MRHKNLCPTAIDCRIAAALGRDEERKGFVVRGFTMQIHDLLIDRFATCVKLQKPIKWYNQANYTGYN